MPHNYSAHSKKFRQREFWLSHESPKTRHHAATLLYALLFVNIFLLIVLINNRDTTEYATIKQVNKIETHLFQLEERLVWTDEKIDTMQAVAEASAMQALEEKKEAELNAIHENEQELSELETPVISNIPVEKPVPKKIETVQTLEPKVPPKKLPVIGPKIKKKKIKRRELGIIYKYHKVRQGETLYRIGLKYDVPVTEIRRLNHLNPNESIHPGQRLLVSQGER